MMIVVMVLKSRDIIRRLGEAAAADAEGPCPLVCISDKLTAPSAVAELVLSATIRLPK